MQTGNERKASSWDGTELDVSGPDQNQKKETYVSLLRVTEGSLRAAFPLLITRRACQRHYLISHIPLKSFQWVGFKGWNSGRSCLRPPVAAAVYKPRSALICWLLWYEVFRGSFIRWKEVGLKRQRIISILLQKKKGKSGIKKNICLAPVWECQRRLGLFSLWFWFKADTIPQSGASRSHVSVLEQRAGQAALDCVTPSHLVSSQCSAAWGAQSIASPPDYRP